MNLILILIQSRGPVRDPEKWRETEKDATEKLNSGSYQEEKPNPGWHEISYFYNIF